MEIIMAIHLGVEETKMDKIIEIQDEIEDDLTRKARKRNPRRKSRKVRKRNRKINW